MKAVVQRVKKASVIIEGKIFGTIEKGFAILLGISETDTEEDVKYLSEKIANLRIFEDSQGKMNLSCLDIKGDFLVVSQFTLIADCRKGRRPSFIEAARPEKAIPLYENFISLLRQTGSKVETGEFGASMVVEIHNDGPVTIILDSRER
ncbi:MAG: D-tyrosyl-tRNA(Tyr) deacylase [Candidatus Schekmanbacteria bacterium RIFCSPHIGHO2_02_FULL_38_11]|uniref:D-aminoacyl-tRNA deacylase n=1 Tax=Candidatus Schekmanbacteria bacterium RIFCSPLOWO2_12_FULL_38_15 TaxID=1817883 RepID=A0A1F7SEC8_9BACT|nr:MAG: D-tyrosyl-tRNA(Tyr) deacylase [Candidatus Schekmanbacteria bacterium RIFCSPLOWO2_02_FULL_38_14]OGL52139.1 MAG: D-tyrosyl-tRNA(Tyr) deacylase [Candidatus Schekmanbacteria bacterium RIFCSPLOWO2_12_FULL_38_15]OGL53605.1 MAG: D-tyrosyl-tRNA(Tyr) deacylase [Candidatus Schekmanbacteria bacterium RIFCSPHIGHO2_02_FULL_38_11]